MARYHKVDHCGLRAVKGLLLLYSEPIAASQWFHSADQQIASLECLQMQSVTCNLVWLK